METQPLGLSILLRKPDSRIEIQFGEDIYVIEPETANAIKQGIEACLDHIETLKQQPDSPCIHKNIVL
jgi:hypothetical protein